MQPSLCWKKVVCLENCWSRGDRRIGVAMNGTVYHERQVSVIVLEHCNGIFSLIFLYHLSENISV
jgi:hypothetical protein